MRLSPGYSFLLVMISGPAPNVDIVLSICLQNDYPTVQTKKATSFPSQRTAGPATSTSDLSGSSKSHPIPSNSSFRPRDRQLGKRKDQDSKLLAITFLVWISFLLRINCIISYFLLEWATGHGNWTEFN